MGLNCCPWIGTDGLSTLSVGRDGRFGGTHGALGGKADIRAPLNRGCLKRMKSIVPSATYELRASDCHSLHPTS